ncbi:hypothetical protein ARMSODRAFT_979305 [Armillaria solidipes]|uniref:Uncharacterized protein n=1 Tax=Armillaria solidipes TaxID=1076256 RepID=A0A2H3BB02_9AGAR|nr:hypothetical protein ARMSODRAFT_979305 [Armillaria solidipes]
MSTAQSTPNTARLRLGLQALNRDVCVRRQGSVASASFKVSPYILHTCWTEGGHLIPNPPTEILEVTSLARWAIALNCRFMSVTPTCKVGTETVVNKRIPGWSSVTILVLSTTDCGSAERV